MKRGLQKRDLTNYSKNLVRSDHEIDEILVMQLNIDRSQMVRQWLSNQEITVKANLKWPQSILGGFCVCFRAYFCDTTCLGNW